MVYIFRSRPLIPASNEPGGHACRGVFDLQFFAGQHLITLQVLINGLLHDIFRQSPVVLRIGFQPVTGELLVERRLSVSRFISVGRPEAGAVRGQHLVADDDRSVLIQAEFELGIRDDDQIGRASCRERVLCSV